jgi:hypothetical protein
MSGKNKKNKKSNCSGWEVLDSGLTPLLERIRCYDSVRRKLETEGGEVSDIAMMTGLLDEPVMIHDGFNKCEVKLTEHEILRRKLNRIKDHNVLFDVRILGNGMPAYYICRAKSDFWANHTLIVEDMYRSPGYPSLDDRFCRLMSFGHESYFLRLSHLRDGTDRMSSATTTLDRDEVDSILHGIGRNVLQSAWHEDQLPGILTSKYFGLRSFRDAIELLYLCLSCDLCGLRASVDMQMLEFFETVYPQHAIRSFLGTVKGRGGSDLNDIGRRALTYYAFLSREYGRFLSTNVKWEAGGPKYPLFKLIFGNFYRLESLAGLADLNTDLVEASRRLESSSEHVILEVIGRDVTVSAA